MNRIKYLCEHRIMPSDEEFKKIKYAIEELEILRQVMKESDLEKDNEILRQKLAELEGNCHFCEGRDNCSYVLGFNDGVKAMSLTPDETKDHIYETILKWKEIHYFDVLDAITLRELIYGVEE